jgi:hypothetical protein
MSRLRFHKLMTVRIAAMKLRKNTIPGMTSQHFTALTVLFLLTLTSILCTIVHNKTGAPPPARPGRMIMTQTPDKPGGQLPIPPLDLQIPAQVETATFALG